MTDPRPANEPQPNYKLRQATALTALAGLLAGGVALGREVFESDSKESKLSSECLKVSERVDIISGSVTIPSGINRDSVPRVGHNADEATQLYSDRTEIVTSPIELNLQDNLTAKKWLCYLNADGKISFVAETKDSNYQITVQNGGDVLPLAEARNQPGFTSQTTVRSITPEGGIYASPTELEKPVPIAIVVEDRN